MATPDYDFLLSQYLDGTLSPEEVAAIERALAADAGLRQTLAQYQKLDGAMRAMPIPAVQWDALADRIAQRIAEPAEETVRSYPLPWVVGIRRFFTLQRGLRLAAAAMILLAAFLGWRNYTPRINPSPAAPAIAKFTGPQAEVAGGPAVLEVQVGPPAAIADKDGSWQASPVVKAPTSLVIAAGGSADQDMLLYSH